MLLRTTSLFLLLVYINLNSVVVENVVHYENISKEFDELMEKYGIDTNLPPKGKGGTYTDTDKFGCQVQN